MIALFEACLRSQVVLPFNSVHLHVPFTYSSLVHLALDAVEDVPEDSGEDNQKADHNYDVGSGDPPSVPVLCL